MIISKKVELCRRAFLCLVGQSRLIVQGGWKYSIHNFKVVRIFPNPLNCFPYRERRAYAEKYDPDEACWLSLLYVMLLVDCVYAQMGAHKDKVTAVTV